MQTKVKETVRGALSSPVVTVPLRAVTASRLPVELRERVYNRVAKKVRQRPEQQFTQRVDGVDVRFRLQGTVRKLYWLGAYDPEALGPFLAYARTAEAVLDVGAAEGVYALSAAAVAPPGAVVVAVEPGSAQLARLRANVELNHGDPSDRVVVLPLALADRDGTEEFHELPGGTSSLNAAFRPDTTSRTVEVARGDRVLPELLAGRRLGVVKADTESTEPEVLAGMESLLAEHRPAIFCEVLAGRCEDRLQLVVDRLGYTTWLLTPDGPQRRSRILGDRANLNWLFLPDDSLPLRG